VQCSRASATKNLWAGLAARLAGLEIPRTARNDTPAGTHAVQCSRVFVGHDGWSLSFDAGRPLDSRQKRAGMTPE
jgi:hypothetical protein